jgi:purine-binding chemotaxis protein CheW
MSSDERPGVPATGRAPASTPEGLLNFADAILARPTAPALALEAEVHPYVTFFLGREEFGLPILGSREIVRVAEITRIPEAPPHVRGVLNLRGRVVPVVELRTRLGLPIAPLTPQSRVIMVEAHGRLFGLLVDRVARIAKIPTVAIKPAPAEALSASTDYVTGIAQTGQELIILLDVDKVLLLNPTAPLPPGAASESRK